MDRFFFGFITASVSSLLWPQLPNVFTIVLVGISLVYTIASNRMLFTGIGFGIIWMGSVGHCIHYWQLPNQVFSQPVTVLASIDSLHTENQYLSMQLSVNRIDAFEYAFFQPTILVSWQKPTWIVQQGQTVRLQVKLKKPYGLANKYGFNRQKWLFANNILATGYVRENNVNQLTNNDLSTRQSLVSAINELGASESKWLLGLSLGYRGLLTQHDWQVLQKTGTSHLMAISGLHLMMLAFFLFHLGKFVCALLALGAKDLNYTEPGKMALLMILPGCAVYCYLAGMAVPTKRALAMLLLATILTFLMKNWQLSRFFLASLTMFILLFPLSVFTFSFWLSFAAVASIALINWLMPYTRHKCSILAKCVYIFKFQFAITILMLSIVASIFGGVSLASAFVNVIAVPIVTFVLLPLSLLSVLALWIQWPLAPDLLIFTGKLCDYAVSMLTEVATWSFLWLPLPINQWWQGFLLLIMLLLWCVPSLPLARPWSVLLILPFLSNIPQSRTGQWEVTVFDVGQGLAVVVVRGGRAMLYDTGAAFPSGFNMVDAVIMPYLHARQIEQLDWVILSHGDNDHSGGASVLADAIEIRQWVTNENLCYQGKVFNWQGLTLEFLWPISVGKLADNSQSCVMKISDDQFSLLLSGDVEKTSEFRLVQLHRAGLLDLFANVLIAPHHGSKTSSTLPFLKAISPELAIFSQGYKNRWNMPHPDVIERYQKLSIGTLDTSSSGQITLVIEENKPLVIEQTRKTSYDRWYLPARTD